MKISKTDKTMIAMGLGMVTLMVTAMLLQKATAQTFENPLGSMYEDQVIVCVTDLETSNNFDHICHLYNADDLDWYQDSRDGTFFNKDDSFDMDVVD